MIVKLKHACPPVCKLLSHHQIVIYHMYVYIYICIIWSHAKSPWNPLTNLKKINFLKKNHQKSLGLLELKFHVLLYPWRRVTAMSPPKRSMGMAQASQVLFFRRWHRTSWTPPFNETMAFWSGISIFHWDHAIFRCLILGSWDYLLDGSSTAEMAVMYEVFF